MLLHLSTVGSQAKKQNCSGKWPGEPFSEGGLSFGSKLQKSYAFPLTYGYISLYQFMVVRSIIGGSPPASISSPCKRERNLVWENPPEIAHLSVPENSRNNISHIQ